jgi:hypothetical protein
MNQREIKIAIPWPLGLLVVLIIVGLVIKGVMALLS